MAKKSFSIKESIQYVWKTVWNQPNIILYLLIAVASPQIISFLFDHIFSDASDIATSIFRAAITILSMVFSIGMIRIALNVYEKKALKFENLYQDWRLLGWYLLAGLLNAVVVCIGLILLIIPGIHAALRLSLWPYIMVEGEKGPVKALKKSWAITKGVTLKLLGFYFVQGLLMILGIMALGVGLIIALPVISLAQVYIYKKIASK